MCYSITRVFHRGLCVVRDEVVYIGEHAQVCVHTMYTAIPLPHVQIYLPSHVKQIGVKVCRSAQVVRYIIRLTLYLVLYINRCRQHTRM
jgi:hypothetical protein